MAESTPQELRVMSAILFIASVACFLFVSAKLGGVVGFVAMAGVLFLFWSVSAMRDARKKEDAENHRRFLEAMEERVKSGKF